MLIISYMSRLNSSQVTLLQQQPHYLQRRWRIPRRVGILKYENGVYCPPDDQYAPKKLQRDCVWLSHLKGFAYICDALCNRLPALWNTSIWDCGELSRGESTARVGGGARPRPPGVLGKRMWRVGQNQNGLPGPPQGRTLAEAFCCDQLGSLWPRWEESQTPCVKLELKLSHHDETI